MAITIEQVAGYLNDMGVPFKIPDKNTIIFGTKTKTYRDLDGDRFLGLVIKLEEDGEYFKLFAPNAFRAVGPHVEVFLRACAIVQWLTKLVQFEFDHSDGEIRPIIEFPVEDGSITQRQLERCVAGMIFILDKYYPVLKRALDDGVIDFPEEQGRPSVRDLVRMMVGELSPEERRRLLEQLTADDSDSRAGASGSPREL